MRNTGPKTTESPNAPTVAHNMKSDSVPGLLKETPTVKAIPANAGVRSCLVRSKLRSAAFFWQSSGVMRIPYLQNGRTWQNCAWYVFSTSEVVRVSRPSKLAQREASAARVRAGRSVRDITSQAGQLFQLPLHQNGLIRHSGIPEVIDDRRLVLLQPWAPASDPIVV